MAITFSDCHIEQIEGPRWRVTRPSDGTVAEFVVDPAGMSGRDHLHVIEEAARAALAKADS